jgi:hypothetical protein
VTVCVCVCLCWYAVAPALLPCPSWSVLLCRQAVYMTRFMDEAALMCDLKHPNLQGLFGGWPCTRPPLPSPPLPSTRPHGHLSCTAARLQVAHIICTSVTFGILTPLLAPSCDLIVIGVCVNPFALLTEFARFGSLSDVIGSPPVRAEASQCSSPVVAKCWGWG